MIIYQKLPPPLIDSTQAINALIALHTVMPEELKDKQTLRSVEDTDMLDCFSHFTETKRQPQRSMSGEERNSSVRCIERQPTTYKAC